MRTRSLHCWLWFLYACTVRAEEPTRMVPNATSPVAATPSRHAAELDMSAQGARDWGLTPEEWTRYKQLMRGPLGIYSPNIDPLTALGTEARSESERQHIAELQVRMEAQRVEKLFTYQRAYDAAWKRVFPTLPPFEPSASTRLSNPSFNSPQATPAGATQSDPTRLAVFVKEDCPTCDQRVKDLASAGTAFDLYMVGSRGDDARIQAWASRLKINPAKVRAGTITLNHDAGRWYSMGGPGSLPAVLHSVNGRWTRE